MQTVWRLPILIKVVIGGWFCLIEDSLWGAEMVYFCTPHIQGSFRSQTLLLPACVDDYVGPDNVVRFIEVFVECLDFAAAGFDRALPKATGRPGYDPSDLVDASVRPDFKTIADFRRENKTSFRKVFREFVVLCRSLDLFGRERGPYILDGFLMNEAGKNIRE